MVEESSSSRDETERKGGESYIVNGACAEHPSVQIIRYNKLCGGFEDMFLRPSASVLIEKDKAFAATTGTLRYVTPLNCKLVLVLPYVQLFIDKSRCTGSKIFYTVTQQ